MTDHDEQQAALAEALAQAPCACPDPTCAAGDENRIGLMMRAQRPLQIAAITSDDPSAVQFFWWCGACGLRWFNPPPPRPLVDLFLRTLRFVSPERTEQAGGTEAIPVRGLAELAARLHPAS